MTRLLTLFVGIFFFLVAVMGMIPGATLGGRLFGLFSATFFNQAFYFILGLFALSAWLKGGSVPKAYLYIAGILLIFLGIAGFYQGEGPLFHLLTLNNADSIFNLIIGALLVYFGYILHR
jgi:hypothetical protein